MRYFLDTEFIEDGKTIELISIAIVAEDGRELYLCNKDCDFSRASDWVWENVLNPIGVTKLDSGAPYTTDPDLWVPEFVILDRVLKFCGGHLAESGRFELKPGSPKPEFWAYYADYDWVVFCQLFGRMIDLPLGFPMYCKDLKQELDRLGVSQLPAQENEHNALADARWVWDCYTSTVGVERNRQKRINQN